MGWGFKSVRGPKKSKEGETRSGFPLFHPGLCQKEPVFPISAMVATISLAYSRPLETQFRSIRLLK